jgi:pimeloyl-ACP methyl ester carboxylesterase
MRRVFASTIVPASSRGSLPSADGYGVTARPSWRDIDWPAHVHRTRLGGADVAYVDIGPARSTDAKPVVFVHGLSGQWQNWLENIPRTALDRRVVAVDLPGFGVSGPVPGEVTIPGYGRIVEELCERLELGAVALVGNSMGGFITAETAIQFPARVERLVLVSAAGISSVDERAAPILTLGRIGAASMAAGVPYGRRIAARPGVRHFVLGLVARHPSLLAPDLAYEGFIRGSATSGFNPALRAVLGYDFRHRLPEIACPTLIVWGEQDAVIPVRDAQVFERLIPDSRKVVMRDTGHVSMAERPEAFNELLVDFLAETGSAESEEPVPGESQAA